MDILKHLLNYDPATELPEPQPPKRPVIQEPTARVHTKPMKLAKIIPATHTRPSTTSSTSRPIDNDENLPPVINARKTWKPNQLPRIPKRTITPATPEKIIHNSPLVPPATFVMPIMDTPPRRIPLCSRTPPRLATPPPCEGSNIMMTNRPAPSFLAGSHQNLRRERYQLYKNTVSRGPLTDRRKLRNSRRANAHRRLRL